MSTESRSRRNRSLLLRLLLPAIFVLLGCPAPAPPQDELQVFGLGATLTPGSSADFLVQLVTHDSPEAASNRRVTVELQQTGRDVEQIFRGRTDDYGVARVEFDLPDFVTDPNVTLMISAETDNSVVQKYLLLHVADLHDLLLTTDKPVYQPGQTIHLRSLALARANLHAAQGQTVTFSVTDPRGNKLAREEVVTSDFGVAATNFALDSAAASGDYLLAVELGPSSMSTTVEVKPYVLPRFDVEFTTERTYYLPGEEVAGTVRAEYFFGKPVAGGTVALRGFVTDVGRSQEISLTGTTDAHGLYRFSFTMPEYFVLQQSDNSVKARTATLDVEVEVTDSAAHREQIDESVTVGEARLIVDAVPEMGGLVAGTDNIVYIGVTYPDGSPAPSELTIWGSTVETQTLTTDENGLAQLTIFADAGASSMSTFIHATDLSNPELSVDFRPWLRRTEDLLIRPDKTEYAIGDVMLIDFYTPLDQKEGSLSPAGADTIYLSVEKNGESHALAELPLSGGYAQAEVEVTEKLLGTVTLRAATHSGPGAQEVAERYVLVNPPTAEIEVTTDAEVYQPGGSASLDVQLSRDGEGLPGVVGVSIVDESVFALGDTDPGFARTYFLIDRKLQELPYSISGFTDLDNDDPSPYDQARLDRGATAQSRDLALAALLASETVQPMGLVPAAPSQSDAWAYLLRMAWALPVLGLALYDGSRKRRTLLLVLTALALAALVLVSCAMPAAPAAPAAEAPAQAAVMDETTATRGSAPPRLRQFFPETLLWLPEVETDASGHARIEVPIADSITTWRVSLLANDAEGTLGSADLPLRVFQEFFVEPDLPTHLTVGDELQIPVSIFNYLDREQAVTLSVEQGDWYEFTGEPQLQTALAANEVSVLYLPIRVTGFGERALQVTATGESQSDAVLRTVRILPDGELRSTVRSGVAEDGAEFLLDVPESTMAGASSVTVRFYPGLLSHMTQGLEGMLQSPNGCFEQVTSTTWPNVLILDYLRRTERSDDKVEADARAYIRAGYQQLVNYEVSGTGGGFSYWGDPPPEPWLTAYGLMEFTDMDRVAYVDPDLISRTAHYLLSLQGEDGSWNDPHRASGLPGQERLAFTAFVVWALGDAGYAGDAQVQRGVTFIRNELAGIAQPAPRPTTATSRQSTSPLPHPGPGSEAPVGPPVTSIAEGTDPYVVALAANALLAAGENADVALELLVASVEKVAGDPSVAHWRTDSVTWTGAWEMYADMETTALAAHALLRAGAEPLLAERALNWLLQHRGYSGSIGTTQTTVLTLRALALSATAGVEEETAITVRLGDQEQEILIPPGGEGLVRSVRFDGVPAGEQLLTLEMEGGQHPPFEMITEHYAPWETGGAANQSLQLDVSYDRTELVVNESVQATARVELLTPQPANMLLVELGIPPGFRVERGSLDVLVDNEVISDYLIWPNRIEVYLADVQPGQIVEFSYTLVARLALSALTPPSRAYDYYMPDTARNAPPQRIVVRLR